MRTVTRALATVGCAAVIGLASATPAFAATETTAGPTGGLVAKGTAVDIPITMTCDYYDENGYHGYAYVSIEVSQTSGRTLVRASNSTDSHECWGYPRTEIIRFSPWNNVGFKKGKALVRLSMVICSAYCYGAVTKDVVVTFTN